MVDKVDIIFLYILRFLNVTKLSTETKHKSKNKNQLPSNYTQGVTQSSWNYYDAHKQMVLEGTLLDGIHHTFFVIQCAMASLKWTHLVFVFYNRCVFCVLAHLMFCKDTRTCLGTCVCITLSLHIGFRFHKILSYQYTIANSELWFQFY